MLRPKSKNHIFVHKKSKKATNIQNCHLEKIPEWFGHKTGEPTGFHDNVVIIQCKLMFPKKVLDPN